MPKHKNMSKQNYKIIKLQACLNLCAFHYVIVKQAKYISEIHNNSFSIARRETMHAHAQVCMIMLLYNKYFIVIRIWFNFILGFLHPYINNIIMYHNIIIE